ncbi:hypothetical protein RB594_008128 [Gaeumannomyces avenae]
MASSLRARFSSHVLREDPGEPRLERKKITVAGRTRVQYWVRPGRERDYVIERRQRRYQSREEMTEASTSRNRPLPILDTAQHGMSSAAGTERGERVACSHTCRVDIRVHSHGQSVSGYHREPPSDQRRHGVREARVRFDPNLHQSPSGNERPSSVELGAPAPSHYTTSRYEPISVREREDHLDKTPNHRHRFTGTIHQEKEDSLSRRSSTNWSWAVAAGGSWTPSSGTTLPTTRPTSISMAPVKAHKPTPQPLLPSARRLVRDGSPLRSGLVAVPLVSRLPGKPSTVSEEMRPFRGGICSAEGFPRTCRWPSRMMLRPLTPCTPPDHQAISERAGDAAYQGSSGYWNTVGYSQSI